MTPSVYFGKEVALNAHKAAEAGYSPDARRGHGRRGRGPTSSSGIGSASRCGGREEPQSSGYFAAQLADELLGAHHVRRAVGVLHSGEDDALARALKAQVFVSQIPNAAVAQNCRELRQVCARPLVVAADKVAGGKPRKLLQKATQLLGLAGGPAGAGSVYEVACEDYRVGSCAATSSSSSALPSPFAGVQVGQLNDAKAVKDGGQAVGAEGVFRGDEPEMTVAEKGEKGD